MRTLLVFLILLNLVYAGWQYFSPEQSVGELERLPKSLKTLVLLNEEQQVDGATASSGLESVRIDSAVDDDAVIASENTRLESGLAVEEDQCYTLGPFKDKTIMKQLQDSISEYAADMKTRKRVESEKHRYWVYLATTGGRAGAKKTAAKLRDKKINEFYIVLKGDAKNNISLGHFREQSGANRRLKQLVKLGFNAEIKVIYRDYDVYWLDYRVAAASTAGNAKTSEYQSEGVSRIRRECDIESN